MRWVAMPARVWRRIRPPEPIDSSSGCAITTSRPPFCSSIDGLGYAVFDLPRVVEGVPGGAPDRVGDGPSSVRARVAEAGEERLAVRRLQAHADPLAVFELGVQHVLEHLVAVPSSTARSLAQFGRRVGDDPVEVFA